MRGTVVFDIDRCKGCALCVAACPKGLIQVADCFTARGYHPATLVDPNGLCTGCLLCATVCPDAGIKVYREIARRPAAPSAAAAPVPGDRQGGGS